MPSSHATTACNVVSRSCAGCGSSTSSVRVIRAVQEQPVTVDEVGQELVHRIRACRRIDGSVPGARVAISCSNVAIRVSSLAARGSFGCADDVEAEPFAHAPDPDPDERSPRIAMRWSRGPERSIARSYQRGRRYPRTRHGSDAHGRKGARSAHPRGGRARGGGVPGGRSASRRCSSATIPASDVYIRTEAQGDGRGRDRGARPAAAGVDERAGAARARRRAERRRRDRRHPRPAAAARTGSTRGA